MRHPILGGNARVLRDLPTSLSVTQGQGADAPGSDILPRPGELNRGRPALP